MVRSTGSVQGCYVSKRFNKYSTDYEIQQVLLFVFTKYFISRSLLVTPSFLNSLSTTVAIGTSLRNLNCLCVQVLNELLHLFLTYIRMDLKVYDLTCSLFCDKTAQDQFCSSPHPLWSLDVYSQHILGDENQSLDPGDQISRQEDL